MSVPVYLPYQRGPLHDLPDTSRAYDAVLADVTGQALARMTPQGNLEHPSAHLDIGDTSLGVTSLLALAWRRGRDPRLPDAVRRGLAFHLRERVHTEDNPGYPNLRVRDWGLPYARYVLKAGAHPIGDWPSTVWALLQAVDLLDAADGLLDDEQRTELLALARGYWRWLTEATFFNPQRAGNQAIGCVVGGLLLARHLPREQGESTRSRALALFPAGRRAAGPAATVRRPRGTGPTPGPRPPHRRPHRPTRGGRGSRRAPRAARGPRTPVRRPRIPRPTSAVCGSRWCSGTRTGRTRAPRSTRVPPSGG